MNGSVDFFDRLELELRAAAERPHRLWPAFTPAGRTALAAAAAAAAIALALVPVLALLEGGERERVGVGQALALVDLELPWPGFAGVTAGDHGPLDAAGTGGGGVASRPLRPRPAKSTSPRDCAAWASRCSTRRATGQPDSRASAASSRGRRASRVCSTPSGTARVVLHERSSYSAAPRRTPTP